MESNFVDYVKIRCRSGKGGKGSMHLKHIKYNPNGGPDGGDGGKGGSIYLRGNHNYWTLLHLRYQRHIYGGRDKCHGTDGKDIYIDVPCGTVVYDAETGKYVCDVTHDGQTVMLLKGGRGGLGNFQFRTATNQAPRYAQPGEPAQEMTVIMELRCGLGRLPQCRQIHASLGFVECKAEDCQLSLHHDGTIVGHCQLSRPPELCDGRYSRYHRGRQ